MEATNSLESMLIWFTTLSLALSIQMADTKS